MTKAKYTFFTFLFSLFTLAASAQDYLLAARVETVSTPFSLGKMKVYPGLRVYNPQLLHIDQQNDSILNPESNFFAQIIPNVDILSGKRQPGRLLKEKTRLRWHKTDRNHLEVSVDYTYQTDSVPLLITIRKSLLRLNDTPMAGRPVDKRLGFKSNDNKVINRFRVSKAAADNAIVFYVSDEFPEMWQDAIRQGIEDWNLAFSRIGLPGIVKAKRYSEAGAGFDPFDITNNCIFSVESDFANAMGNHWTDPRSGEIIQADVQLYSNVTEKLRTWLLLQTGAYNKDVSNGEVPETVMKRMLRYAVAHEIGHCLGLEHNYKASSAYATENLRDKEFCKENGTTPSIMDYARFNYVAQPGDGIEDVYPPVLGSYDVYAIEAGYGEFASDNDYHAFIDKAQQDRRLAYQKMRISPLPLQVDVQPADLGDNAILSSRYGIRNIAALPVAVLRNLKADEVYDFYFQLLMHTVPLMNADDARSFLEQELNEGYKMLDSKKMRGVYGNRSKDIENKRDAFIERVRKTYDLAIINDPQATGLWMPHQAASEPVFDMLRQDGLRLSKSDIYALNKRCMAGAVLSLSTDNGVASPYASASFVSKDGLVLTNFHCVSAKVQALSRGENDYMKYGCWTTKREEEAPLFGLQLHELLSIEDITNQLGDDKMAKAQAMMREAEPYGVTRRVYSLAGGQQYVMARYRTFNDVRIVACPPMSLGAKGGDDANWRWPRHTADFAFLRAYVSPEGEVSDYSKMNVPYHPKSYLKAGSSDDIREGEMVMVMGYPGQTRKNIPAYALDKIVNRDTQLRANMLKAKIDFLRKQMEHATGTKRSGYEVRISKLMNVYLRSMGEIEGVRSTGLVEKKRREDMRLQQWIDADNGRRERYGSDLIARMDSVYGLLTTYNNMDEAFSQFVGSTAGIIPFAGKFEKLIAMYRSKRKSRTEDMSREVPELQRNIREFFPSISMQEDCGMMKAVLPLYVKAVPERYLPEVLKHRDLESLVDSMYATSILTDSARLERMLESCTQPGDTTLTVLTSDALYRMCLDIYMIRVQKQNREATPLKRKNMELYNLYMQAKMEMNHDSVEPYEANHTMRFSPGKIKDINQECFTTNAETAAGNSGSAVVNARGRIIGLNFDRTLESTYSIYRNDPLRMRNICVRMDYILDVIRNHSHSQHILKEIETK